MLRSSFKFGSCRRIQEYEGTRRACGFVVPKLPLLFYEKTSARFIESIVERVHTVRTYRHRTSSYNMYSSTGTSLRAAERIRLPRFVLASTVFKCVICLGSDHRVNTMWFKMPRHCRSSNNAAGVALTSMYFLWVQFSVTS